MLAVALAGCNARPSLVRPDAAPADSGPAAHRQILGVFPGPAADYEISYLPCPDRQQCPISLTLRAGSRVLDAVVVDKSCGEFTRNSPSVFFGIAADTPVWAGNCQLNLAARAVNLAPGEVGLLVSEELGEEHIGVHHRLYRSANGKVVKVWDQERPAAFPMEVRVVSPPGAAHQDLAVLYEDRDHDGGDVTDLRAVRLHWEPTLGRLIESPLPTAELPLGLLYLGPYRNQEAGLASKSSPDETCDFRRTMLAAKFFPGLGFRGVVWGRVFLDLDEAARARRALEHCPGRFAPRYVEYVPGAGGGFEPSRKHP